MPPTIFIPTPLRKFAGNSEAVEVEAGTVDEILNKVDEQHPGFRARLCHDTGELRRFINIYINGEDVRFLKNLSTPVPEGAEVSIIPAIAGG